MGRMCEGCFESYSNDIGLLKVNYAQHEQYCACPKRNCDGRIIEVDDMIAPAVKILNEKGYFTTGSCSGHMEEAFSEFYIEFMNGVTLETVPKGCTVVKVTDEDGAEFIRMSKKFTSIGVKDAYQDIMANAFLLYRWADDLEELEPPNIMIFGHDFFSEEEAQKEEEKLDKEALEKIAKNGLININDFLNKKK